MRKHLASITDFVFYWFGYERPEADDTYRSASKTASEASKTLIATADASPATTELHEKSPASTGKKQREPSGLVLMVAGSFFFSLMSLLVKIAGTRLPSQEIVLLRAIFTLFVSYIIVVKTGISPRGNRPQWLVGRGIFGFIGLSGFYFAVVNLPLADATVIQFTNPAFAALLAVPILKERLHVGEISGLLLGFAGVFVMSEPTFIFGGQGNDLNLLPVMVGLLGACGSGAAYVLVRKLGNSEHPLVIVFYFALVSVILSLPALLQPVLPTAQEWIILLFIGITTQLGQVSITRGLAKEKAGRAASIGYLQILFAAIWSTLFLSQPADAGTFAGATLIIIGTLFSSRSR